MVERIDIGNVRGIKGDIGEKGDIGNTPTYDEIKYAKNEYGEYVTIQGEPPFTRCYEDSDGNLCNESGHLIENGVVTENIGTPFDESEYGYLYKPIDKWIDGEGNFTNNNHELISENGDTVKVLSTFIGDILTYLFGDAVAYNKITDDIAPKVAYTLLTADPTDKRFKNFFDELEGDIKYYVCEDNPELTIIKDGNTINNTCKYQDENGNVVLQENSNVPAYVPLEKNTLYLYNGHGNVDDNSIMYYDIYVCTKANTIPKKLVDINDFRIDYNVIDDLTITVEEGNEEDEYDVYLNLYTKGDYGEFYNKSDIDDLFDEKVDDKLGAVNGIAELDNNGKIKSTQLPSTIGELVENKEDSSNKVTTLDNSDTHYPSTSAVTNVITLKEDLSNKVITLDNSDTHYPSTSAVTTAIASKEDSSNKVTTLDNSDAHYPTTNLLGSFLDIFKQLITLEITTSKTDDEISVSIESNVYGLEYEIGAIIGNEHELIENGVTIRVDESINSENAYYSDNDYYVTIKLPNSDIILYNEEFTGE